MAKRRSGATTRAHSADRSQSGGRRRGGGASSSKGKSSSRAMHAIVPREGMTMTAHTGRGSKARGGGMMSGARSVAEKVGKTTMDAAQTTMGAAREWAVGAADAAGNVASRAGEMGSQVAGKVRENPWPSILIGAGATWLAVDAIRGRSDAEERRSSGRSRRSSSSNAERGTVGQAMSKVASAGRAAGGQIRAAGGQIEDFVRERPLLAGAATLGLGMAVGMALPSSVTENEMFGNARDKVVSRARSAARDTMDKVRDVAESVERLGPFGGSSGSRGRGGSRG